MPRLARDEPHQAADRGGKGVGAARLAGAAWRALLAFGSGHAASAYLHYNACTIVQVDFRAGKPRQHQDNLEIRGPQPLELVDRVGRQRPRLHRRHRLVEIAQFADADDPGRDSRGCRAQSAARSAPACRTVAERGRTASAQRTSLSRSVPEVSTASRSGRAGLASGPPAKTRMLSVPMFWRKHAAMIPEKSCALQFLCARDQAALGLMAL